MIYKAPKSQKESGCIMYSVLIIYDCCFAVF